MKPRVREEGNSGTSKCPHWQARHSAPSLPLSKMNGRGCGTECRAENEEHGGPLGKRGVRKVSRRQTENQGRWHAASGRRDAANAGTSKLGARQLSQIRATPSLGPSAPEGPARFRQVLAGGQGQDRTWELLLVLFSATRSIVCLTYPDKTSNPHFTKFLRHNRNVHPPPRRPLCPLGNPLRSKHRRLAHELREQVHPSQAQTRQDKALGFQVEF